MKITPEVGDLAVLGEIGNRVMQVRITMAMSQAALAKRAGIGKRTLERLENGESVQFVTLIRVLRELGLLDNINVLAPESGPRPMDYLARKGHIRQRAPRVLHVGEAPLPWKWGDEQ